MARKPGGGRKASSQDDLAKDLDRLQKRLRRTLCAIPPLYDPRVDHNAPNMAAVELESVIKESDEAAHDVLHAMERIQQDIAGLRSSVGSGENAAKLDRIEAAVAEAVQASAFQDICGQRLQKVVGVLFDVERGLAAIWRVWGKKGFADIPSAPREVDGEAALLNGPQLEGEGLSQDDIDGLLG